MIARRGLAALMLMVSLAATPVAVRGTAGAASHAPRLVVQGPAPLNDARFAWSRDGKLLLSASPATLAVQLWDGTSGNLIANIPLPLEDASDLTRDYAMGGLAFDAGGTTATVKLSLGLLGGCLPFRIDIIRLTATPLPNSGGYCFSHDDGRLPVSPRGAVIAETAAGPMLRTPRKAPVKLGNAPAVGFSSVVPSPDMARVALLHRLAPHAFMGDAPLSGETGLEVFDLSTGTRLLRTSLSGRYAEVHWLAGGRLALIGDTGPESGSAFAITPVLVLDVATRRIVARVPGRCLVTPYGGDGGFVAGKASDCANATGKPGAGGLWIRPPGGTWRRHPDPRLQALTIDRIAAAPGAKSALILAYDERAARPGREGRAAPAHLFLVSGPLFGPAATKVSEVPMRLDDTDWINSIGFGVDGATAYLATNLRLLAISTDSGHPEEVVVGAPQNYVYATPVDLAPALAWGIADRAMRPSDAERAARLRGVAGFQAAGRVSGGRLAWTAASDGTLRFYDRARWALVLTLQNLGDGFVAYDSAGRYDSALGPDSNAFRWLFPDDPLRSLGGQTFMRDYLEPQLYARTLACVAAGDCAVALPPPPPVGALNRTLPAVRIARVRPGRDAATAIVDVEAASVDAPAANGRTRSGVYDLRLFRDGKLVGQSPYPREASRHGGDDGADGPPAPPAAVIAGWRQANRVPAGRDGIVRRSFTVRLPTGWNARTSRFTAYAFNDDRVKSDTARLAHTRPRVWPARPRAYILTIGIDAYRDPSLSLGYAAADADLLGERLARVAGHAVRELRLRGRAGHAAATRQAIADAIALLGPGDHRAERARLRALGVDAAGFDTATPDDLVIISYAGHGWADARGRFYLVPQDGRLFDGFDTLDATDGRVAGDPDPASLISAARLTDWLRPVDAGEAAIIIDACQSAASVAAQGFKPGPMGDRGLGQLAYDKGIRILVASRGDQKAREDARLGHGLLTAALGRDGLDGQGFGHADIDGDGRITLDEWLRYAVARLPALGAEVAARRTAATGRDFVRRTRLAPARTAEPVQQPALFDFNTAASPIVLGHEPATAHMRRLARHISDRGRSVAGRIERLRLALAHTLLGPMVLGLSALVAVGLIAAGGVMRLVRWRRQHRRVTA